MTTSVAISIKLIKTVLFSIMLACVFAVFSATAAENLDSFEQLRASQKRNPETNKSATSPVSETTQNSTELLDLSPPTPKVESEQLLVEEPKMKKETQTIVNQPIPEPLKTDKHIEAIKLSGRTQLDYRQHSQTINNEESPPKNSQFSIRRARLEFHGSISPNINFKSSIDVADTIKTKDVYVDVKTQNGLTWRGGQFKYPFGNENISSSRYYEFLEMSILSNTLSSNRDRGILVNGTNLNKKLIYNFGMVSGTGSKPAEQNSGLDFFAHIATRVIEDKSNQTTLWLGGSASTGKQQSSNTNSLEIVPESESGFVLFSTDLPNDTAYTRQRYEVDTKFVYGPFFVGAEYLNADYTYSRKASINGGYVMASYFLTGEQRTIEEGELAKQQISNPITRTGGWGAWEIALRYSQFNVSDNFFIADGLFQGWEAINELENARRGYAWTIGLNWYPDKQTRAMLNWVQTKAYSVDESTGSTIVIKAEDALLIRGQIEF